MSLMFVAFPILSTMEEDFDAGFYINGDIKPIKKSYYCVVHCAPPKITGGHMFVRVAEHSLLQYDRNHFLQRLVNGVLVRNAVIVDVKVTSGIAQCAVMLSSYGFFCRQQMNLDVVGISFSTALRRMEKSCHSPTRKRDLCRD